MVDTLDRRHSPDGEITSIHEGSIHLDLTISVQVRAVSCVEGGVALQDPDRGFNGVYGGTTPLQDRLSGRERLKASAPVGVFLLRSDLLGPAMDDKRPGHALLRPMVVPSFRLSISTSKRASGDTRKSSTCCHIASISVGVSTTRSPWRAISRHTG